MEPGDLIRIKLKQRTNDGSFDAYNLFKTPERTSHPEAGFVHAISGVFYSTEQGIFLEEKFIPLIQKTMIKLISTSGITGWMESSHLEKVKIRTPHQPRGTYKV